MLPIIAIVGRPNVGKSTLFNCITQRRDALVADFPGLTRDRQYGEGNLGSQRFIVIDTGGLGSEGSGLDALMIQQTHLAIEEAHHIIFLVDARNGLSPEDEVIAEYLRKNNKPVSLVVNKIDGLNEAIAMAEFYRLGIGKLYAISAAHGQGVQTLITEILQQLPLNEDEEPLAEQENRVKIAIAGRPNAGKSTLINRMLGEERVIVFDEPGTTRDSIYVPFDRRGKHYILIDTAGIRRRSKVTEAVEKFSIVKTLQSIEEANVVILVIDAHVGVTEHDLGLIGFIMETGRAMVIAINKWDGLSSYERDEVKREVDRRLVFIDFAKIHFISALHGTGVGDLFGFVDQAYRAAMQKLPTPKLTRLLQAALAAHQPPLVHGRRIKLRYAHAGGQNPPLIVIHGNQVESLPDAYKRFLISYFRKGLKLMGTPVRLEFQSSENPYKGRKNALTERQRKKRKRLIRHNK